MAYWESLLGLPLEIALERARALGVEPAVLVTRAPRRRGEAEAAAREGEGTMRVIRVRESAASGVPELTVSAFQDGTPRGA